ncbi:unnamed protein product [Ectocarpus sp. 12 AP-2014]
MTIKRIMMLGALAFIACCPIANSFVYRFSPVQRTFNTNSMLGRKQRGEVGKTIGVPSGETIDGAGVGRTSGAVAIEEKVRIPRVPSALDPEGTTRRVDSPLHLLGKGGDGEGVPVPDGEEFVLVVRERVKPQSHDDHHDGTHQQQLIQKNEAVEDEFERRLHHHGSRPRGRYRGWTVRWEGFQRHCCTSGLSGLRSTSPTGAGVGDGFCSICDIEHTQHEAAAPTTGAIGYPDSAASSSSGTSEPSSDTKSVPVESRSIDKYRITSIAESSRVTNNHSRHGLEKAKSSSELPSRAVDARPLQKQAELIQDDKSSAPTHDGSSPARTRIAREAVSDGQGHDRKKVGRSYPTEDTSRSFSSLHLQQFNGPEDFNQGPPLTFPYFPAEIPPSPVQPGATPAATAAAGHGTASRSTPPPRTTGSAAEAPAEESPDYVDMLTAALHDAWGRGAIRGTSNVPAQDGTTAARQSSAWWPSEEAGVDADKIPQVFHDAWRKRGVRSSNTLSMRGTAPAEAPEWVPSTLSQGHREQAKTKDDHPGKAAPASHPPKNGRIRRWFEKARRGWANRRGSRTRRRRDDLTW